MADDELEQGNQITVIKCSCGKMCKVVKGLKMHQRRCRVIKGPSEDQVVVGNSNIDTDGSLDDYTEVHAESLEYQNIKPGICCLKGMKNKSSK